MAGYIGNKAVGLNVTTGDILGDVGVGGVVTANAGVVVDEMTLDADTLTATDDFIIDAAGEIVLDSATGITQYKDGGTEFLRITESSGDIVIQSVIQDKKIFFSGDDGGAGVNALVLDMQNAGAATFNTDVILGNAKAILFGDGSTRIIGDGSAETIKFFTSNAEKVRIAASGNFLVGTTTAIGKITSTPSAGGTGYGTTINASGSGLEVTSAGLSNSMTALIFKTNHGTVGSITCSNATSFNTSSDYRLKTDAQPMTGASARVLALKPLNFEWIASGTRTDGFLAHEAQAVVPEAVTGIKDAMMDEEYEITPAVLDDDDNETKSAVMGTRSVPDMQGIDQSKIVPLLVAALQEALARITVLENA